MQINKDRRNAEVDQNGHHHPENEVEIDRLKDLNPLVACPLVSRFVNGVSN